MTVQIELYLFLSPMTRVLPKSGKKTLWQNKKINVCEYFVNKDRFYLKFSLKADRMIKYSYQTGGIVLSDTFDNRQPDEQETVANAETEAQSVSEDYNSSMCVSCQKNPREEGSYYCPECRTAMLKTKIKAGSVFAAVLSVLVSFGALLLFAVNFSQMLPLIDADIHLRNGYVNAAANSVSQVENTASTFSDTTFAKTVSEITGGQSVFSVGNAPTIMTAKIYEKYSSAVDAGGYLVQTVGEDEIMSNPIFLSVRKYVKEYNLYLKTQEKIYGYFSEYETAEAKDVPYDDLIKKLDSHKGEDGIGDHYIEYYKCYAAVIAGKGYEEQNKHLLKMEELYPDGILIYGSILAENYYNLGDYDKVIEYSDKMLAQNRNYSAAYELKFMSYLALDDFAKAEEVCEDIADANNQAGTDSGDYTEYALRAHLRWAKGEYDEALKTCEEGLEISNGDAEIYRQQAIVYLLKGDYKKAAESANSSYQFAYYNGALDLRILNTAALCAGLAKDDDLYDSVEQTLQSYGYDVSTRVTDCLAGKLTVKEVFTEAGGSEI